MGIFALITLYRCRRLCIVKVSISGVTSKALHERGSHNKEISFMVLLDLVNSMTWDLGLGAFGRTVYRVDAFRV